MINLKENKEYRIEKDGSSVGIVVEKVRGGKVRSGICLYRGGFLPPYFSDDLRSIADELDKIDKNIKPGIEAEREGER